MKWVVITGEGRHDAYHRESNRSSYAGMRNSYLILDEYMRFLDRNGREPSQSILDVGAGKALGVGVLG